MKNISIYTSDTCPHCVTAKDYFKSMDLPYEEKNVKNPQFRKELMAMGIMSVPVIKIEEETVVGFDKEQVEALLNQ